MVEAKNISTSLTAHFKLSSIMSPNTTKEIYTMKIIPYANYIDSIMYMVCFRHDISHAISVTIWLMGNPRMEH